MPRTVAGLFTDRRAAQRAIVDLEATGFDPNRITLSRRSYQPAFSPLRIRAISSTTGAIIGALVLGTIGALIGWAADAATGGNDFLVFIAIALAGGMVGWLVGGLVLASVPIEDSAYLRQRDEDGSFVLRVQSGGREAVARHILVRNGGKDLTSNRHHFPIPPRVSRRTPTPAA